MKKIIIAIFTIAAMMSMVSCTEEPPVPTLSAPGVENIIEENVIVENVIYENVTTFDNSDAVTRW